MTSLLQALAQFLAIPAVEYTLLAAYLVIGVTITVDVLLKRSDVRAATGWIAAAWLSPFVGGAIYFLFGINRVERRALKLARRAVRRGRRTPVARPPTLSEPITLLSQVGERITGRPLAPGNRMAVLQDGDGAYPQMMAAIGAATSCIAMASYIFRDDEAGQQFAQALIAAKARGVEVRVLLDGVGTGYLTAPMLRRLRGGQVAAARFLHTWLPWRMPFLNMRNHRKILVVDGHVAFLGGMNVGRENFRRLKPHNAVTDVHFRLDGPAVRTAMEAFARDWLFTTGENLEGRCWWPDIPPDGPVFARGISSGPDDDIYRLEILLGAALSLARRHVRIITPYFLPDAKLQFAIAQAALRGVKVEIVLPEISDQKVMDWAVRAHVRFFRHIAASFTLTPPPFDHAKLLTVDGEWCVIGSSNWDTRSLRLNFEFDLECYDAQLVRQIDALIDARIARGRTLSPERLLQRPVWIRLRDAAARLLMPYL
jgi:cardiolipin synthase